MYQEPNRLGRTGPDKLDQFKVTHLLQDDKNTETSLSSKICLLDFFLCKFIVDFDSALIF